MSLFDPILVAFDGSPHASAAAAMVRQLAASTLDRSILCWAVPSTTLGFTMSAADRQVVVAEGNAILSAEALRFSTPVAVRILDGEAQAAVKVAADDLDAGLLVLGTHGRGRLGTLLLGSVSRGLLAEVRRPVLVVHLDPRVVRRVVAAVDGGEGDGRVVRAAREVAQAFGATLTLVTAINVEKTVVERPRSFGIPDDVWCEAIRIVAARAFEPVREAAGPGVEERVVYGEPSDAIGTFLQNEAADLVVVGRRGASGTGMEGWYSVATVLAELGPFGTLVV